MKLERKEITKSSIGVVRKFAGGAIGKLGRALSMHMTRFMFRKVTSAAMLQRGTGYTGKERLFTNSGDK